MSDAAVVVPWYAVTDADTLSAHLVSEDALIAGRRAGVLSGRMRRRRARRQSDG